MTTLLAHYAAEEGIGYLASDGQCTAGNLRVTSRAEKTVRAGKWLIGVTGYGLTAKLLRAKAEDLAGCTTVWELANEVNSILIARDWRGKPDEDGSGPLTRNGWMLVVSPEGAWAIFGNGDPEPIQEPTGGGSGGDLATGAAMAFLAAGVPPAEAILRAAQIAVARDTYSGGRVLLETTEEQERHGC